MAIFKDSTNREWSINLDAPTISAVREAADPRFLKGDAIETIERLREDLVMLCVVVHTLCKKQIADRSMTDSEFYQIVIGDTIDNATEALVEAIVNFTPPRSREMLRACAATNKAARETAMAKAIAAIQDPTTVERMEQALDREIESVVTRLLTPSSNALN